VGDCLVNEHHNPANGDGLQETSGPAGGSGTGLLVWRKADNWTAYTDGNQTWINGPFGLEQRYNVNRFMWEPNISGMNPQLIVPESSTEAAMCAVLQGSATGPTAAACFEIWTYQFSLSHPLPAAPPAIVSPPAPRLSIVPAFQSIEAVGVGKVDDLSEHVYVGRQDGSLWYLEYGAGCPGMDLYEGRTVDVVSTGLFAGAGSKIVLPDDGETCLIWDAQQIQ
jgi:hypothetical protein